MPHIKPKTEPSKQQEGKLWIYYCRSWKSNCCGGMVMIHNGEEGTNCHVCFICGKPCDPITTGTTQTASYTAQIGFPHKKTVGIWCWKREVPNGWNDLGRVYSFYSIENKVNLFDDCKYCHEILHIGREDGKLFKFCPRCEVKVE